MYSPNFPYPLYLVISEENCLEHSIFHVLEASLKAGLPLVQLREKHKSDADFLALAQEVKKLTDRYQRPLIINDNLELALQINAFGIHVGNSDISPQKIKTVWPNCPCVGYSIEYIEQLDSEQLAYVDYIAASPVFKTNTKTDTVTEWGIEGIQQLSSLTDLPLVGIGQMNLENCSEVYQAGAHSIAVVSAICGANDPEYITRLFLEKLK